MVNSYSFLCLGNDLKRFLMIPIAEKGKRKLWDGEKTVELY